MSILPKSLLSIPFPPLFFLLQVSRVLARSSISNLFAGSFFSENLKVHFFYLRWIPSPMSKSSLSGAQGLTVQLCLLVFWCRFSLNLYAPHSTERSPPTALIVVLLAGGLDLCVVAACTAGWCPYWALILTIFKFSLDWSILRLSCDAVHADRSR